MGKTNIEYADQVSNPLQVIDKVSGKKGTHCEKPDPEGTCKNCWAEVLNTRGKPENTRFGTGLPYVKDVRDRLEWIRVEKEMARLHRLNLTKPESEKFPGNPLVVFTNDTYDLFQPSISDADRDWVFDNYDTFHDLTLLVQTTYVSRMAKYLNARYPMGMPSHYIVGMSAGTNKFLETNGEHLLSIWAERRYIIFEPLLEDVHLVASQLFTTTGVVRKYNSHGPIVSTHRDGACWAIIGGESGTHARGCDLVWIRNLVERLKLCFGASIFVKQLGSLPFDSHNKWYRLTNPPVMNLPDGWHYKEIPGRKGDDFYSFPKDLRIRQFPTLEAIL